MHPCGCHAPLIRSCLASVPAGLSLGGLALSPAALLSWGSLSRTLGCTDVSITILAAFPCCFPAERDAPARGRGPAGGSGVGVVLAGLRLHGICFLASTVHANGCQQVVCPVKKWLLGLASQYPPPGAFLAKGIMCSSSGAWSRRCNSKQSLQRSCSCPLSLPCRC